VFFVLFFFFQAEDGIRDFHVTGVQTCALPIFWMTIARPSRSDILSRGATMCCRAVPSVPTTSGGRSPLWPRPFGPSCLPALSGRSEERRVGKECRSRGWPYQ